MPETQQLVQHLGTFSYIGIFGISLIANIVIPFPEEIVLLVIGYIAGTGRLEPFFVIPIFITGLLISDIVIFTLAKHKNKLVTLFYEKFFATRLASRQGWIESHIEEVIFYARFMVQLRFLGPFISGQKNISWKKFLTYELAALVVYVPLLIWAGGYLQNRIQYIADGVGIVRNIIFGVIGILVLVSLSRIIRDILFGVYTFSADTETVKTWVPGVYKKQK